jgi:hypothetical protein
MQTPAMCTKPAISADLLSHKLKKNEKATKPVAPLCRKSHRPLSLFMSQFLKPQK